MVNSNVSLSFVSKAQKVLISPPKHSISGWAFDRIEHYHSNKILKYSVVKSELSKRLHALAMPIFALLDVLKFFGEIFVKIVMLRPKDALFSLLRCFDSMKLFLISIPATLVAVFNPELVYKNQRLWKEKIKENFKKELTEKFKEISQNENVETALKKTIHYAIEKNVRDSKFAEVVYQLFDSLKLFGQREKDTPLAIHHLEFFVEVYTNCAFSSCRLEEVDPSVQKLLKELINLKSPDVKNEIVDLFFEQFDENKAICQSIENEKSKSLLCLFLFKKIQSHEPYLDDFIKICSNSVFKDRLKVLKLLKTLHQVLKCGYSNDSTKKLIEKLIESGNTTAKLKKTFSFALENLLLLLQLQDEKLVFDLINEDRFDLSDKSIVSKLIKTVYELNDGDIDDMHLGKLRTPISLLKCGLRLKAHYQKRNKEEVTKKNKELVLAALNGDYWETIHKEEDNPHLNEIFRRMPSLKKKWMNPPELKVSELLPEVKESKYANFTVKVSDDYSDLLLIGDDRKNCLNLDGRIERVSGLLGLLGDGKTHIIVIKSDKNMDASSYATARIQLMKDGENGAPILFLEQVNYEGMAKGDHTLETAVNAFAKILSEEYGLDLVSCWPNHDKSIMHLGEVYPNKVTCGKSSCPMEYVNVGYDNRTAPYSIDKVYYVKKNNVVSTVFDSNQGKCYGKTDETIARSAFDKLQKEAPDGVKFDRAELKGKMSGGVCTALAIKFFQEFSEIESQNPEMSLEEYLPALRRLQPKFDEGGGKTYIKTHRSVQEAFNAIRVTHTEGVDISRNKIQGLLNLYDISIISTTEDYNVGSDKFEKLVDQYDQLHDGKYFVRDLNPKNNEKKERNGHSFILVKKGNEALFYHPNTGLEYLKSSFTPELLNDWFIHSKKKWGVRQVRFHGLC